MSTPGSLSELYPPKWVSAADLGGKARTVKITRVDVETFHIPQVNQEKTAAVLTFEGKAKRIICNKTQARALALLTGSERFADWVGCTVTLTPASAPNGKATISIQRAPTPTAVSGK